MFFLIFDAITDVFRNLIDKIPLHPRDYHGLFPLLSAEDLDRLYAEGVIHKLSELAPALTYCLFLSLARYILQNYVVKYLALWSMKLKEPKFNANPTIDKLLPIRKGGYDAPRIEAAASEVQLTTKEVEKYLIKRAHYKTVQKKIVKYVEAFWRAGFYGTFTYLGYVTLFVPGTVPWIEDHIHNWKEWPNHPLTSSILLYYNIELGCYFHQLLWTDRNHSDALEMTIHHFVTITLIVISFLSNFYRVGTTILFIHDISDVFLEAAKVLNYTSKPPSHRWIKPSVDIVFGIFAFAFFVTRLVIYPAFVLRSVYTHAYEMFGFTFFGAYAYTVLLFSLQGLHIFWFYLISLMIYRLVLVGIEKDVRSDDEDEEEEIVEQSQNEKENDEGKKKK